MGEQFGLDEVFKGQNLRQYSVTCKSQIGSCYFLPMQKFVQYILHYKLIDSIEAEYLAGSVRIEARMRETVGLHQEFLKMQK